MNMRGFILQASYRVVSRPDGQVPVIHIYGRLEEGGTFLVRDDRQRPHFYIRESDVDRARPLRIPPPRPADRSHPDAPARIGRGSRATGHPHRCEAHLGRPPSAELTTAIEGVTKLAEVL